MYKDVRLFIDNDPTTTVPYVAQGSSPSSGTSLSVTTVKCLTSEYAALKRVLAHNAATVDALYWCQDVLVACLRP
jgi:hypothetical protein